MSNEKLTNEIMKYKKWDYCISRGEDDLGSEMFSIFKKGKDKDYDSIAGLWYNNEDEKRIAEPQAKLISKSPEMLEALKGIYRLRNIILPPVVDVNAEHQEEVTAIYQALKQIDSLIKEIE